MSNEESQEERGPAGKIISAIVVVFVVLLVGKCFFSLSVPTSSDEPFSASLIEKVAKKIVKERLISPRSAEFSDIEVYIYTNDPKQFKVVGNVDSQNVFGAMLRKKFGLVIRYEGSTEDSYSQKIDPNNWDVVSFNIE